jgi:hypothetical protein
MSDVYDGEWRLMDDDPEMGVRRWWLDLGTHYVMRTEYYETDRMLEFNAALRSETAGQRFGEMRCVASMPMNVWQKTLAPAIQQQDSEYVRKILNDSDFSKFRTFEGRV